MKTEPRKEHEWLEKFAGEWTMEADSAAPDQSQGEWTETGRAIGGGWVVLEGGGPMPDGNPATTIMTLGYDSHRERYVGTWLGSMMDHLWVYEGTLEGNVLTLDTEGPTMEKDAPRKLVKYKDVMEFKSDDHRVLTSHKQGEDGEWTVFMTAGYRRKR